ncbi:hypothetical protein [Cellulomonas aerilata]|uniref:Uncharacterized protein n=1 Tax=Cellulomonas aerilata TaxID=515326 RepID=A0A512DEP9_9CELL|nr:hypothetical protein [Cellulomonas aerilata]GEO34916.1 hypothetical protein CAE01nite_26410 [Cellulomonas aerilata]
MDQHRPDPARDDAFDRLRDADPAAGLEPDTASLDAAVRERADRPAGDELARARAARRPGRWGAVAAVAAGTLLVGSVGGYALGSREGTGTGSRTAAAAITLSDATTGAAAGAAESSAAGDTAARSSVPDAPAAEGGTAMSSRLLPWFGGHTVFTAQGLSDDTGTAQAWAYDPAQAFSAETAAQVAASLGLAGEPRLEGGIWLVGPQDGVDASLQLQPDGVTSVSYYDPSLDPFACPPSLAVPESGVEGQDGGGQGEPGKDAVVPPDCTPRELPPAPQGDAAVARAREVLAAAGVDADRYEYEAAESGTPELAYVSAFEVVDGQRTGTIWSVSLVGDAVQSLYGALAPLVPLGDYDVVSENEAVARLSDPRFGASGGGVVAASVGGVAVDSDGAATTEPAPAPMGEPTPPPSVTPGSPLGWPVVEVVLTGARLGLAQHTLPTGATVLLPAYELSADDGTAWSVVAVADGELDFAAGR